MQIFTHTHTVCGRTWSEHESKATEMEIQHEWHSKKMSLLLWITIMKDRSNKLYAPLTMKREVVEIQWWLRSGSSLHLEVLVLIVACSKDFGRVSNWCRSSGKQSCIWSGSTCRKAVNRMQTLVKYVGVTRFVFHGLQLLPIRFTQRNETCVIILNLWWSISRNRTSSNLVLVMFGSACLLLIP